MRKIKFRAIEILRPSAVLAFTLEDLMRGHYVFSHPEHYHFVRFTGLTDKNDKDTFEKDIISFQGNNLIIMWLKESFNWVAVTPKAYKEYEETDGDNWIWISNQGGNNFSLGSIRGNKFEVIGNIYQNPELL